MAGSRRASRGGPPTSGPTRTRSRARAGVTPLPGTQPSTGGAERGDPRRAADRQSSPLDRAASTPTTARGGLDTGVCSRLESGRPSSNGRGVDRRRHRPVPGRLRARRATADAVSRRAAWAASREAAGLCWPDIDLDEATLTVSRTLQEHVGRRVLLPPKTAASARTVALDRSTIAVLTAHRAHQRAVAGVDRPDGFVFAHRDGRPYSPSYLTHHFRALQELSGFCRQSASTTFGTALPPWPWQPGPTSRPSRTCSATPASCSPPTPRPVCCPRSPGRRQRASPRW